MAATEAKGIAIRTEDVRRHYAMGHSTIRAVDGVTLDVRRGEFVALLGSSGSGKSTLRNLIAGQRQVRCERNQVRRLFEVVQ